MRTGLSPAEARLSNRFRFKHMRHWPDPLSLTTTSGVSVDVLSSGYLDVSVPRAGTETRPRLLREAAVGNFGQWTQV